MTRRKVLSDTAGAALLATQLRVCLDRNPVARREPAVEDIVGGVFDCDLVDQVYRLERGKEYRAEQPDAGGAKIETSARP